LKERNYRFPKGTTLFLKEKVIKKEDIGKYVTVQELSTEEAAAVEKMEVD